MAKAGIILTTQFTPPNAKSFTDYFKYITREQALLAEPNRNFSEEQELQRIQQAIENFDMDEGKTITSLDKKSNLDEKEEEAKKILDPNSVTDEDFTKYVSYMARKYALEKKEMRTPYEEKELDRVENAIKKYVVPEQNDAYGTKLNGVFDRYSTSILDNELQGISKLFSQSQKKGSIMFQDVISHDNVFLEELGLYNSETDELDERGLMQAGNKMMTRLLEKENLTDTGYWMASIHRNTKHIHIHFALVETTNTREIKTIKKSGQEYIEPKGLRKLSTLDEMKETYGRELRDYALGNERIKILERKSFLRNRVVQKVKDGYEYSKNELRVLNEIYQALPNNQKKWNYGTQNKTALSSELRDKIDHLTKSLVQNSDHYIEYMTLLREEQQMKLKMFGKTKREDKDQLSNALFDIRKRLGNSLLTELKQQDSLLNNRLEKIHKIDEKGKSDVSSIFIFEKEKQLRKPTSTRNYKKNRRPILLKKNLYRIKRAVNYTSEKRKELYEHEVMKRRIQMEQEHR